MKAMLRFGLIGMAMLTTGVMVGRYAVPPVVAVSAVAEAADNRPAARSLEATVYLPLADNAGRPFAYGTWQAALAVLVQPFGGATLGTPQEGCWLDARGRVLREQVRPVVVSFPPGRLDEFRGAVRTVGRHLGQEAMYVRFEEPRVELIPGDANHPGGPK